MRLMVLEDDLGMRTSMGQVLEHTKGVESVALVETARGARQLLEESRYDIVIVDEGLRGESGSMESGCDFISQARSAFPDTRFIVLTGKPPQEVALRAARAGADGFLTKPLVFHELAEAIAEVRRGFEYYTGSALAEILSALRERQDPGPRPPSPAIRDVLRRVASGLSNREIAEARGTSIETVRVQLKDATERLEVGTREEAAREARKRGLV